MPSLPDEKARDKLESVTQCWKHVCAPGVKQRRSFSWTELRCVAPQETENVFLPAFQVFLEMSAKFTCAEQPISWFVVWQCAFQHDAQRHRVCCLSDAAITRDIPLHTGNEQAAPLSPRRAHPGRPAGEQRRNGQPERNSVERVETANVEATFSEFGHLTSSFCRVGFQQTARTKENILWLDAWIDMPSITVPHV